MDFDQELEALAETYTRRGYAVTVRPGPDDLPAFAKHFKVELLGKQGAGGALVAVKKNRRGVQADLELQGYAEAVAREPDWQLDLVLLGADEPDGSDPIVARDLLPGDINQELSDADRIAGLGFGRPAVVTAWAALEASMRMRLRSIGGGADRGTPPREMLNELYSSGLLSNEEFRSLGELATLRNQIVHGFASYYAGPPPVKAVHFLSAVARRLVEESLPVGQPA